MCCQNAEIDLNDDEEIEWMELDGVDQMLRALNFHEAKRELLSLTSKYRLLKL